MEKKHGFLKFDSDEFINWLSGVKVGRTVLKIQQHHTFIPNYDNFKGSNHFVLQKSMWNYHVNNNGWSDIGQHISIFPDGVVVTRRSFERSPACIFGSNAHSICIENVGNFDTGKDVMNAAQRDSIINVTAALCKRFNVSVTTSGIIYHHWFDLDTGHRNNGIGGVNKTCPGTNFFGGNRVQDAQNNFLPLINTALGASTPSSPRILRYGAVTASKLNVRSGPGANNPVANNRRPLSFGAVVRIFAERNKWYKISGKENHWVSGNYVSSVRKAVVTNASQLNVRLGPGTSYGIVGTVDQNDEIFIETQEGSWSKLLTEEKWVSSNYLNFD